jgi:glucose/arabinose dehydrogenase
VATVFPVVSLAQSEFQTPDHFTEDVVLDNLPIATAVAFGPEERVFIALKEGSVRVAQNGTLLPQEFINISTITNKNTDRGLLGIALDPRAVRLVRVHADAAKNYNVALPDSMEIILGKNSTSENMAVPFAVNSGVVPEPASCMTGNTIDGTPIDDCLPVDGRSHSAGTLIFAADGSLYVSVSDGSSYDGANRPALRTQMIDSLAGKVLRIDPDTGTGLPGNPFYDPANPSSNRSKVWAYGLRNPFRMTLNPVSGQVYLGDVGSSGWEEVNSGKGTNFGWPCYEGGVPASAGVTESGDTASLQNPSYATFTRTRDFCRALYSQGEAAVRSPLFAYAHEYVNGEDQGASVTGVAF